MKDRKSNATQVLNLLFLNKKLEETRQNTNLDGVFYLTYLYEISKKNIEIARVNYTDPTGMYAYWEEYNYNNRTTTTTTTTNTRVSDGGYTERSYGYNNSGNITNNYDTGLHYGAGSTNYASDTSYNRTTVNNYDSNFNYNSNQGLNTSNNLTNYSQSKTDYSQLPKDALNALNQYGKVTVQAKTDTLVYSCNGGKLTRSDAIGTTYGKGNVGMKITNFTNKEFETDYKLGYFKSTTSTQGKFKMSLATSKSDFYVGINSEGILWGKKDRADNNMFMDTEYSFTFNKEPIIEAATVTTVVLGAYLLCTKGDNRLLNQGLRRYGY